LPYEITWFALRANLRYKQWIMTILPVGVAVYNALSRIAHHGANHIHICQKTNIAKYFNHRIIFDPVIRVQHQSSLLRHNILRRGIVLSSIQCTAVDRHSLHTHRKTIQPQQIHPVVVS
jgi:hypothetical protein